jgi:TolB-like protein/DNA-binding winged helix-turn-helix (wHTH) protein
MNISVREHAIYAFGPFRLDPLRHVLLRDGDPVSMPPRLFATLLYLVTHAGRVVEREELQRAIWGGRVVDESNLKQTIFSLRKILHTGSTADRFIVTAPTRGYLFAAPVSLETPPSGIPPATASSPARPRAALAAALLAGALAAAAIAWRASQPPATTTAIAAPSHSIAVLAFANLSGDPAQKYFSDGIADELIASLSRIGAIRVAARSSAFSFQGKQVPVTDIGRALNVATVLEGSVRRNGAHVRITAELVDAATGFNLWARSFDSDNDDILRTQAEIAASVVAALQVTLLRAEADKLTEGGTANQAALDAYLRAAALTAPGGPQAARAALPAYDEAIALDPHFAMARARRAQALLVIGNSEPTTDVATVRQTLGASLAESARAIALAPNLGTARLAHAAALMSVQDFIGADKEMSLAHDLAPGDFEITMAYALTQLQFGRGAEGVRAAEQAAALDPLTPGAYLRLASALVSAQRYGDATVALRRARILGGQDGAAIIARTMALGRGDFKSALPACTAGQGWRDLVCLALAYHGLGRQADAEAALSRLHTMIGDTGAFQYAEIYAQWGDKDAALRWLQTAERLHDTGLVLMKWDALLSPIRNTPDYQAIEKSLNFPP